jgi:hypothetical protein
MHFNTLSNQSAGNKNNFGSSETTRVTSFIFFNWLAGLIDGDGLFVCNKKGYWSCEITLKLTEHNALSKIKSIFGGSIQKRIKTQTIRWRLTNKKGLLLLINALNGRFLNPVRKDQFIKLLINFNLVYINYSQEQLIRQGWLTGFFEAKGCFLYNSKIQQLTCRIIQKNKYVLDLIIKTLNIGNLYFDKSWNGFIFDLSQREHLLIILKIFYDFPFLSSSKQVKLIQFNRLLLFQFRNYHLLPLNSRKRKRYENLVKKFLIRNKNLKEEDIVHSSFNQRR